MHLHATFTFVCKTFTLTYYRLHLYGKHDEYTTACTYIIGGRTQQMALTSVTSGEREPAGWATEQEEKFSQQTFSNVEFYIV